MYILLILIVLLLVVSIIITLWLIYRNQSGYQLSGLATFTSANTRHLTTDERDAVDGYLATMLERQVIPHENRLALNSQSNMVYTVSHAITCYGLTTDQPYQWRYYLDSTEIHLPLFWEQHISENNHIELIPTQTLPLVISLNGHRLADYVPELRHLLPDLPLANQGLTGDQSDQQIKLINIRKETAEEHALHRSNGWLEALLISIAFLHLFLCLKTPEVLIPWLLSGAIILILAGLSRIFWPVRMSKMREIHCLQGTPKCWGLFGEVDQEEIDAISLGTIDLIYPLHWQPFIQHELGQKSRIEIYLDRHVVRQGNILSLHDEVKNFPIPYWVRSSILSAGSFLVLMLLIIFVPLEMPLMLTTSWLKGAQTIQANSVRQLEKSVLHVGDTLRLNGIGMCNIHPGSWSARQNSPFIPFDCSQITWNSNHAVVLPESDIVVKASALMEEVNQQLHAKNDNVGSINSRLASAIQQSGMVLLDDFSAIVLKTQALCTDDDECIRLKNALVNLSNNKDWDTLTQLARSGELRDINVLLRPVSAEALDNLVSASTAPFFIRETSRAAQALNSSSPGSFVIINEEGGDLVDQPFPAMSLYDYPAQEQWTEFRRLSEMLLQTPFVAEGIITNIHSDDGTQHIVLHSIPDSTSVGRYIGTTLLLIAMVICSLYNGIMAVRRHQISRNRLAEIQQYYEDRMNLQLNTSSGTTGLF